MGRASDPRRRAAFESFYEIDRRSGATLEVFYAHRALADSFGARRGWFWWLWPRDALPDGPPAGPFVTAYGAYRNATLAR
jgi:hypothetical protein